MGLHIASARQISPKMFRILVATQIVLKGHKNNGCKKPIEHVAEEVVAELATKRPESTPYDLSMVNRSLDYLIRRGVLEAYKEDENTFVRVLDNHLIRVTLESQESSFEPYQRWYDPTKCIPAVA